MINASSHSVSDFCIRGTTVNLKKGRRRMAESLENHDPNT